MKRKSKRKVSKREGEFLAAIQAEPADRSLRLVYADWLDEQGDSYGEMVRVEETMRSLPVWSDHYWKLKPRRNELLSTCDEAWLGTMLYARTDYEPLFKEMPVGVKERWRLIRELVDRWHGISLGDVGTQAKRIRGIEKKAGYKLPFSVHEWIAFLYDIIDDGKYDRAFRDCLSFTELKDHPAFSLMVQGENDYHWAVKKEHLGEDDPPVDGYNLDYENDGRRFVHDTLCAPQVTTWVLIHLTTYMGMAGTGGGFGADVSDFKSLHRKLTRSFATHADLAGFHVFELSASAQMPPVMGA